MNSPAYNSPVSGIEIAPSIISSINFTLAEEKWPLACGGGVYAPRSGGKRFRPRRENNNLTLPLRTFPEQALLRWKPQSRWLSIRDKSPGTAASGSETGMIPTGTKYFQEQPDGCSIQVVPSGTSQRGIVSSTFTKRGCFSPGFRKRKTTAGSTTHAVQTGRRSREDPRPTCGQRKESRRCSRPADQPRCEGTFRR